MSVNPLLPVTTSKQQFSVGVFHLNNEAVQKAWLVPVFYTQIQRHRQVSSDVVLVVHLQG